MPKRADDLIPPEYPATLAGEDWRGSFHREQEHLPHVVIVGGGFGGLQAARALGKAPVRVTVIDRTNHHLFQPLLYQVATAALSPADISAPIRHVLRHNKNTRVLLAEVTGVDTVGRRVLLDERGERSIPYDYLIIATGAGQNYFGHREWARYAPGLKTLEDATRLRRQILLAFEAAEMESDPDRQRALLTFVLVGAGPTGVEMAGAIAELAHKALASDFRTINPHSARIILVEAAPRILLSFPPELAEKARRALNRLGVEVRTSAPVEAVDENGVVIGGEYLPAKTIIWTAGVEASPAGRWLQAEVDRAGRVKVNPDLSVPGHPEIFVIGDTAHLEEKGQPLPGLAPVAMQEGRYVARAILQRLAGQEPAPFHYVNKGNLATVGRAWGLLQIGRLRLTGFLAWILWLTVHIFYLIGFRNRVLVLFQWAWAYLTFQRGARLILYPERADSREAVALAALD
ncbi:NAD(P)/FAD-dependent oxidoreductase [Thermogemmatispora carboxidivorans]|uniref:NAD(P)/FAD-dependent oxidoreductase n=1 Tax=Thermogemmatispora carboxidivorans TaxID=1382306 RepID=UPI0009DD5493|nr:NAD(P)/FAD-dependent oxidoreductase [Thermogemmatispora carboxidivorans]